MKLLILDYVSKERLINGREFKRLVSDILYFAYNKYLVYHLVIEKSVMCVGGVNIKGLLLLLLLLLFLPGDYGQLRPIHTARNIKETASRLALLLLY